MRDRDIEEITDYLFRIVIKEECNGPAENHLENIINQFSSLTKDKPLTYVKKRHKLVLNL